MTTRSIDPTLFSTEPELRLIGGRDLRSGRFCFPLPADPDGFERLTLPDHGLLWSFTIQRIAPKSPPYRVTGTFTPFAVGYVELPDAIIVESRLTDVAFDQLHIGMPMELTSLALYADADGSEVLTYAFRPQRRTVS